MENAALSESKEALVSDRDRIAREARSIGYIRTDEKIIQLTNVDTTLASPRAERLEPIRSGRSSGLPDGIIKLLSLLTGAAVLLAWRGLSPQEKTEDLKRESESPLPGNRAGLSLREGR